MSIRPMSEVMATEQWPGPGWRAQPPDIALANPTYGVIAHGVVCDERGLPRYDIPLWADPAHGAIAVPEAEDGRLLLLEQWRPAALLPPNAPVVPPEGLHRLGASSLELPRGFGEPGETPEAAAMREVAEETGWTATEAQAIGWCNPNTTFWMNAVRVVAVRVCRGAGTARPDEREQISRVCLLSREEIRRAICAGAIFCGMTLAALACFEAHRPPRAKPAPVRRRKRPRPGYAATTG